MKPETLTFSRAREILETARDSGIPEWKDRLDRFMSPEEQEYIKISVDNALIRALDIEKRGAPQAADRYRARLGTTFGSLAWLAVGQCKNENGCYNSCEITTKPHDGMCKADGVFISTFSQAAQSDNWSLDIKP